MQIVFLSWFHKSIIASEFVGAFFITFAACVSMFIALRSNKFVFSYHFTHPWAILIAPILIYLIALFFASKGALVVIIGNPINLFINFFKLLFNNFDLNYFKGFFSICVIQFNAMLFAVILYKAIFKKIAPQNYVRKINNNPDFTMHTFKEFATLFILCASVAMFGNWLLANNLSLFFVNSAINALITGLMLFFTKNKGYFTSNLNVLYGVNFIYLINKQKTWKSTLALVISTFTTIIFCAFWALMLTLFN